MDGRVEQHGIRCCYHGRVFDVDGTILEMPGEPDAESPMKKWKQGAYPTHTFGGIVFACMGPIERIPPFPRYDRFELPGDADPVWTPLCPSDATGFK